MTNVPPSVRAALKRRGADSILKQEGDYSQYKEQIDQIIHSDNQQNMSDDVMIEDYEDDLSPEEQRAQDAIEGYGEKYKNPAFHWEDTDGKTGPNHIVIDEGEHKNERYDNLDDFNNSDKLTPDEENRYSKKSELIKKYKSMGYTSDDAQLKAEKDMVENYDINPKKYEDYDNLRYYPVSEEDRKAAGARYLGDSFTIGEAFGLNRDNDTPEEFNRRFKYVGDAPKTGHSIYQLPDNYFSMNPRITGMSFKNRDELEDYLEHEYDDYNFDSNKGETRIGKYKEVQEKRKEDADNELVAKTLRESLNIPGDEVESILKGMNSEAKAKLLQWIKTPRG